MDKICVSCVTHMKCKLNDKCSFVNYTDNVKNLQSNTVYNNIFKDFESGAKSSGNIPPYECLTIEFLRRAAERMRLGFHYGKHNWKKGAKDKQFILDRLNHAMEHLVKAAHEIDNDTPMTDDDLAAVVVNCMFAMEYQKQK